MDVVRLRLEGVPISAIGEGLVERALREIGYAELSDDDVLRLLVAGAPVEVLARATGLTPGQIKKMAREAYRRLRSAKAAVRGQAEAREAKGTEKRDLGPAAGDAVAQNQWVELLRQRRT